MKTNHSVDHLDIRFSSTDANNSLANERHSGVVKSTVYGYIRVSTREQNEARQVDAMERFGVDRVMMDKQSGKNFDRPAYQRLLRRLKPGDVLVVKSIDRLGRNYTDILEQWRIITKEKQVAIVVIDMPLLDTRSNRDLTGTLIADIVLELLSYVAETERAFIKQRQAEGIAAAKSRGVRFGPPAREKPEGFVEMAESWRRGDISAREAGRRLGVPHTTFLKWARSVKDADSAICRLSFASCASTSGFEGTFRQNECLKGGLQE